MRVLLAHKFHKHTGGADVFYLEVGRILKENGHQVAYFSTLDEDTLPNDQIEYFIKAPDFKSDSILTQLSSFLKIPYNFEAKKKFDGLIKDFKPDIIHIFGIITQISPSILDAAKDNSIPVVASLNDYKHICPNYKLFHHGKVCEDCMGGKFYNAVLNKCSHNSYKYSLAIAVESYIHSFLDIYRKNIDLFLFASEFMAKKTQKFWGDTFSWGMLQNPFDFPVKNKQSNTADYGLYFGRFAEEKCIELIVNALEKLDGIPFKFIGNGPEFDTIKKLVIEKNIKNVEFLGALWEDDLNEILYNARYVVVPSIWYENFPYVVIQSFAAGVPVIGSNRGGIPELIDKNRGKVFDVDNLKSLVESMKLLHLKPELAKKLGSNARNYIEKNFNDNTFYMKLITHYNSIVV